MRAGSLDRRIVIEAPATVRNTVGEDITTWSTLAAVAARKIPQAGAERFSAGAEQATADVIFRIRYRSDVTTKMRVVEGGNRYDITALIEIGRRDGLDIVARTNLDR